MGPSFESRDVPKAARLLQVYLSSRELSLSTSCILNSISSRSISPSSPPRLHPLSYLYPQQSPYLSSPETMAPQDSFIEEEEDVWYVAFPRSHQPSAAAQGGRQALMA